MSKSSHKNTPFTKLELGKTPLFLYCIYQVKKAYIYFKATGINTIVINDRLRSKL